MRQKTTSSSPKNFFLKIPVLNFSYVNSAHMASKHVPKENANLLGMKASAAGVSIVLPTSIVSKEIVLLSSSWERLAHMIMSVVGLPCVSLTALIR